MCLVLVDKKHPFYKFAKRVFGLGVRFNLTNRVSCCFLHYNKGTTTKIVDKMIASSCKCLETIEKALVYVSQTTLYRTQNYKNTYLEFGRYLLLV